MVDSHPLEIRVYYEDTDVSGVVYHANYLRWIERGRTEWLRALGFGQQTFIEWQGIAFTISTIDVRFLRPARLDDLIRVDTAVTRVRRASLEFHQRVVRDSTPLMHADVRIGCVDTASFRPTALPQEMRNRLHQEGLFAP